MSPFTSERSPRAFLYAVLLHALAVGLALVSAWWMHRPRPEQPQIFELVAGEGQDYAALEAPTTTTAAPPTVKLELPEPPAVVTPAPQPEPPAPKIEPAPEPKAQPKQETPPPPKKVEKKADPPPKIERAPERMTLEDFRKQHGAPKVTPPKAAPKITPKTINADSIAGRVAASSTNQVKAGAGGEAMSRVEADLWAAYRALIIQRIRRAMQAAGVLDLRSARVEFHVSSAGAVSRARITGSSGSGAFDAAVLDALRSLGQLGPPPSGQAETLSVEIEMRERS